MFHCKLRYVFSFSDTELGRFWLVKFAILLLLVVLLLKYGGCLLAVLKVCGLWKNIFWGTGCWGWLCIIIVWVNICMDLQKLFPKSVVDLEIPCNDSAKTRFDSHNVFVNVLRNCAPSFACCNSSWSLCAADNAFCRCFCLLSINLGTCFCSDLCFADEFALLVLHLLLSLCTHLINPLLDCRHFMRLNLILTDDDEKEAADGIALLFDDNSCS